MRTTSPERTITDSNHGQGLPHHEHDRTIALPRTPGQGPHVDDDTRTASPLNTGSPIVHHALSSFLTFLAAAGVSPGTLRLRSHYLHRLEDHLAGDLLAATTGQLAAFLARPRWSPDTRKSARATLRVFYAWAHDEELVDVDPARRLPAVRVPTPLPRCVPLRVFAGALARADVRGRRALMLGRYAGLRRAEIAAVHSDDVVELRGGRRALRVRGKGQRIRLVPLHPRVAEVLAGVPGWAFPSDRTPTGHLTPDALGHMLGDLLGPGWTAHTLRHRAASDWYAVDRDLVAVQRLLGHASIATTQTYVEPPADALTTAVLGVA